MYVCMYVRTYVRAAFKHVQAAGDADAQGPPQNKGPHKIRAPTKMTLVIVMLKAFYLLNLKVCNIYIQNKLSFGR